MRQPVIKMFLVWWCLNNAHAFPWTWLHVCHRAPITKTHSVTAFSFKHNTCMCMFVGFFFFFTLWSIILKLFFFVTQRRISRSTRVDKVSELVWTSCFSVPSCESFFTINQNKLLISLVLALLCIHIYSLM